VLVDKVRAVFTAARARGRRRILRLDWSPTRLRGVRRARLIVGRLRVLLLDQDYRYDLVDAVLAEQGDVALSRAGRRPGASRWAERPDWNDILSNYARCVRITREFAQAFPLDITARPGAHDARRCTTPISNVQLRSRCIAAWTGSCPGSSPSCPPSPSFFVDVLVMAQDVPVRQTRLALLQRMCSPSQRAFADP